MRTAAGVGAILFTLISGWITVYASVAACLYAVAGMQALLSAPLLYAIYSGWMDDPPEAADFARLAPEGDTDGDTDEPGPSAGGDAHADRPAGTTRAVPVAVSSRFEGAKYSMFWLQAATATLQALMGYSTKCVCIATLSWGCMVAWLHG